MPKTDREHLKALVGGLDLWHQFGAELPVDKAYKDAKHHIASTPDTGGVEGREEDWKFCESAASHIAHFYNNSTAGPCPDEDMLRDLIHEAIEDGGWVFSEGHKAGASGSGEGGWSRDVALAAYKLVRFDTVPGAGQWDLMCEYLRREAGLSNAEAKALMDEHMKSDLATQNPASGSDGLRARVEKVLECVEDYGRKLDKGGGEHRMYLRQFIQKELPHKLAAALADGGMGDE